MRNGISGASIPMDLPYAGDINTATLAVSFFPILAYAIAEVETIEGERAGWWNAATVIARDNGKGLCQITQQDWWPGTMVREWAATDWKNPCENAKFGIKWFMAPAEDFWVEQYGMQGMALVRCIAGEYNAGRKLAIAGHNNGDVGMWTTHEDGVSYSDHVAANYTKLVTAVSNAR